MGPLMWVLVLLPFYLIAVSLISLLIVVSNWQRDNRKDFMEFLTQLRLIKHQLGNILHAANLRCELLKIGMEPEDPEKPV